MGIGRSILAQPDFVGRYGEVYLLELFTGCFPLAFPSLVAP